MNQNMNNNNMNNNNMNTNVGITNPSSGAVYTSGTNLQQGPGVSAGAVYTSGVNTSGAQNNYNQRNINNQVGVTDPNSGAVYTTSSYSQQDPGVAAGAVYTSGVNTSGVQNHYNQQSNINSNLNNNFNNNLNNSSYNNLNSNITDPRSGAVYTSNIHSQQDQGVAAGAVYTSGTGTINAINSGVQSNYNQQRNLNNNLNNQYNNNYNSNLSNNITDPTSGAVYTSNIHSQQGVGVSAGAVYTSGTGSANVNNFAGQSNYNQQRNVNSNLNTNLNNNINSNINNNTDPRSGAVYTSNINLQQDPGVAAGAVYTSGVNTSGVSSSSMQNNYNQQRNYNNVTDHNSGAVYTSDLQQGPSNTSGVSYTSNVNNYGMRSNVSTGSMGMSGIGNAGVSNVQQIKQQLQNIQTHLRQSNSNGSVNEAYTDAANRLQDVFEILNNSSIS